MEREFPAPKKPMIKKKTVILSITLALLICILFAGAILPLLLKPIATLLVKEQVAAEFGDKLHIGSARISFFNGTVVQLNQIALAQAPGFGKGNLLQADNINLRVALIPLLQKRLVIKNITVVRPEIEIIQYQNGDMNIDYYLTKFSGNTSWVSSHESSIPVRLDRFNLVKSKIIFKSYAISHNHQPTLVFNRANLTLNNLVMPNPDKIATEFSGSALLGTNHPAQINFYGTGLFGGNKLSFSAKSRITGLFLTDYTYLVPDSKATVKSGQATINSDMNCHNDYLNSYHHVVIRRLELAPKSGPTFTGTLMGAPANLLIKGIQDGKGRLNFDFNVSGRLTDLRVNVKFRIIQAVAKSLRDKLNLDEIGNSVSSTVKNTGNKVVNVLKRLFKH